MTRQFETSHPLALAALGRSDNYPRSVTDRAGSIQSPRSTTSSAAMVRSASSEKSARGSAAGEIDSVLLVGSEAMSTARHFAGRDDAPDHSEERGGQLDDRGYGIDDMITPSAVAHRVYGPPAHYAARTRPAGVARAFAGGVCADDGWAVRADVGGGGDQPHSAAPTRRSATELVEVTEQNRLVADPYPRCSSSRATR